MSVGQHALELAELSDGHAVSFDYYESVYKNFHANPELSHHESATSASIAEILRKMSPEMEIRTGIGGHGLIAILKNGPGKTVLIRADMDALPVEENTGLEYASKQKWVDGDGTRKSVMHACGHDFHITCLLAAAEFLTTRRSIWTGCVVFLFQPAEETGEGAKAMIAAGLYDPLKFNCPVPDVLLGQHVVPIPAGTVAIMKGVFMSSSDNFKITIHGRGGHGSMPHLCIDPIVIACHIVVRLQTLISREVPPDQSVVLTVGSLHAGHAENVIADEAILKLNIRSVSTCWRDVVIDGMRRIVEAECTAGKCAKPAGFEQLSSIPLMANDLGLLKHVSQTFHDHFGSRMLAELPSAFGSEDFSVLATAVERPYCFWFWGGGDARASTEGERPAINHSPMFAPAIHPTLKTGTETLVVAALTFLRKRPAE